MEPEKVGKLLEHLNALAHQKRLEQVESFYPT